MGSTSTFSAIDSQYLSDDYLQTIRLWQPQNMTLCVNPQTGLLEGARLCLSPNRDSRPPGAGPELIVIHCISLPPGVFGGREIEEFFCNRLDWDAHPYFQGIRGLEVSAHLLVRRDGTVLQFVPFGERAWHAGDSIFRRRKCCNDFSIGIELEGEDTTVYEDAQYDSLTQVISSLFQAYPGLTARSIAAHSDISPGRKTDPGPVFDWLRLYDELQVQMADPDL
jgi:AmpD protein